jgi:hypothetical protein
VVDGEEVAGERAPRVRSQELMPGEPRPLARGR